MIATAISIIIFGNFLALFLMWMCGNKHNIVSRTQREMRLLEQEDKGIN
jgi:hypothetical protein